MGDLAYRHRCLTYEYSHIHGAPWHSGRTYVNIGLTLRDRSVYKYIYRHKQYALRTGMHRVHTFYIGILQVPYTQGYIYMGLTMRHRGICA
jgi:hypothetical protein